MHIAIRTTAIVVWFRKKDVGLPLGMPERWDHKWSLPLPATGAAPSRTPSSLSCLATKQTNVGVGKGAIRCRSSWADRRRRGAAIIRVIFPSSAGRGTLFSGFCWPVISPTHGGRAGRRPQGFVVDAPDEPRVNIWLPRVQPSTACDTAVAPSWRCWLPWPRRVFPRRYDPTAWSGAGA
jgi:hypothetical protein